MGEETETGVKEESRTETQEAAEIGTRTAARHASSTEKNPSGTIPEEEAKGDSGRQPPDMSHGQAQASEENFFPVQKCPVQFYIQFRKRKKVFAQSYKKHHTWWHAYSASGETTKTPLVCIRPAKTLDCIAYNQAMVNPNKSFFCESS